MIENKTTEFKREYIDDIKYTVVAFANTEGGKIYIGMSDDGSVYGVENTDATMLRITNMIRDSIVQMSLCLPSVLLKLLKECLLWF